MELAPYQIRVNAVAPAVVATPIYERFVPKDKIEETMRSFDRFHPLGRVGTADDVGEHNQFSFGLRLPVGSLVPSGTLMAGSWPDVTK